MKPKFIEVLTKLMRVKTPNTNSFTMFKTLM